MSDYLNFPSEKLLLNILEECPRSALVYLKLWEIKHTNTVRFNQKDIRKIFFISNTILKNHLYALEKCKLLSFYYKNEESEDAEISIVVSLNV